MQITLDIPDNLPASIMQQYIAEFEKKVQQYQQNNRISLTEKEKAQKYEAMMKIGKRCASLPDFDLRSSDEILGYDKSPMGLWGDE